MRSTILLLCPLVMLASCKPKVTAPTQEKKSKIVFYIELDSAGNITDTLVKKQLTELAVGIGNNADKVIIYSYAEKRATPEESMAIATQQANAAKAVMSPAHERVYYNVGIDAKGFVNPVDAADPASPKNRRIEIEYLR